MLDFLTNSLFFGVAVSLAAYEVGSTFKEKIQISAFKPTFNKHYSGHCHSCGT